MKLTIGILAIGSLYWRDTCVRNSWRKSRLTTSSGPVATAPIRYGRRSTKSNTYTMVFSSGANPGRARVLGCQHPVTSANDLISEAEQLWTAERDASTPDGCISAGWGCVALLIRPGLELPRQFLDDWASRVSSEANYDELPKIAGEGTLVNKRGILEIGWPEPIDSQAPIELDLLLATATHPSLLGNPLRYPSPEEVAEAWGMNPAQIEYFRENRAHSICTFQDQEILAHLKEHFPTSYDSCHSC